MGVVQFSGAHEILITGVRLVVKVDVCLIKNSNRLWVEDGSFPTLDTKANQPGIADGVAAYRRWGITSIDISLGNALLGGLEKELSK